MTSENQFVLLCSLDNTDQGTWDAIKKAVHSPLDWERVFEISARQRVLPVVYENIRSIVPDEVPKKIFSRFKSAYLANTGKNLAYAGLLLKIIDLLEQSGVQVLPFKGPVMAEDVYGDIALRVFSDLDILVSSAHAVAAWKLFEAKGFQPELELDDGQKNKYVKTEDNLSFFLKNKGIEVELHWELSGCYLSAPLTLEQLQDDLCRISILKKEVQVLYPEMLLLYLCIHGAKEGWSCLEQVCAVTEIIRRKNELDWSYVELLASRWKCRRILGLGLTLAVDLFSAPLPARISEKIQKDQAVKKVSALLAEGLFQDPADPEGDPPAGRFSFLHLRLKDSFAERVRYAVKLAFSPTKKEWLHYPLPAKLSFLHYVLRPYRLIRAGLGR